MISGATRVFAILGSPVGHSLSPAMQTAAFTAMGLDAVYVPLPCDASHLQSLIAGLTAAGGGGNVTVPHKAAAVESADHQSEVVRVLGACNTFWGDEHGPWVGNTDVVGVRRALEGLDAPTTAWLVIGTGGSARAVVEAAREMGAAVAVKSRSVVRGARFRNWITGRGVSLVDPAAARVVINATPLGLNDGDPPPVTPEETPEATVALDLVYRPGRTSWVRACLKRSLAAEDGRSMLVAQGAAAFELWYPGLKAPTEVMRAVVDRALR